MTVKILQFGVVGQLGTELLRQAGAHDVAITARDLPDVNLADPAAGAALVERERPELVVIAAAYTAVDPAETERDLAFAINAQSPGAIAQAAARVGAAVINVSTDYVFDGAGGAPYAEDAATNPLNVYGASKLAGELAVAAANPRSLNIRTSWVVSAHGKNFVKTMIRVAAAGNPLTVVDDQSGKPTAAADLAAFILQIAPRLAAAPAGDAAFGTVHFANAGEVTWRGFAQAIVTEAMGDAAPEVAPTTTEAYGAPAPRPLRTAMDTGKLTRVYGVTPRPWQDALKEIVAELKSSPPA